MEAVRPAGHSERAAKWLRRADDRGRNVVNVAAAGQVWLPAALTAPQAAAVSLRPAPTHSPGENDAPVQDRTHAGGGTVVSRRRCEVSGSHSPAAGGVTPDDWTETGSKCAGSERPLSHETDQQ